MKNSSLYVIFIYSPFEIKWKMNLRAFSKVGLNPYLFVLFLKLVGGETYFAELKEDIYSLISGALKV